jgi:hypothetical protein
MSPINEEYWWNLLVCNPFYRKETELLYELFGQMIWRTGKPDVLDQVCTEMGMPSPLISLFLYLKCKL